MLADFNSNLLILGGGLLIAYFAVLWVAVAFYVVRDARRRSTSILFTLLAAVLGFFPPFLGALIYLVIRPPRTLVEERQVELEEEALREVPLDEPTTTGCTACGREIERDFILCPYCHTQFARRCPGCARALRLGWDVCPYCATDASGRGFALDAPAAPPRARSGERSLEPGQPGEASPARASHPVTP